MKKGTLKISVSLPKADADSGIAYSAEFIEFVKAELIRQFTPDAPWVLKQFIIFSDRQAEARRRIMKEQLKAMKGSKQAKPAPKADDERPTVPQHSSPPSGLSSQGNDSKKANGATNLSQ